VLGKVVGNGGGALVAARFLLQRSTLGDTPSAFF
jgi:hypothetical protein